MFNIKLNRHINKNIFLEIKIYLFLFKCMKEKKILFKNNLFLIELKNIKDIFINIYFFFQEINNTFLSILIFIKHCSILNYNNLVDIACIDQLNLVDEYNFRFKLIYIFSSYKNNKYIYLSSFLKSYKNQFFIESLTYIFSSSNWIEREIWEMFGIFFFNHYDLRRLLTDYSFTGYPLRKDYPLSGYIEIRFDDSLNTIIYEPIVLSQAYRIFSFQNPWIKN